MHEDAKRTLRDIATTAGRIGPALAPVGSQGLLQAIISVAKDIFSAAACSLALVEGDELVFHVASGQGDEDVVGMRVPIDRGIAGWVVNSGQPIAISDVRRDPRFASDVAESTGYVPTSILAMPLETDRRTLGVIEVLDRDTTGRDATGDMALLARFAMQASLAIEQSLVFSDLGRALFQALAAVADERDLSDGLLELSGEIGEPDDPLIELAAHLSALARMGEKERRTAARILEEFVRYARR